MGLYDETEAKENLEEIEEIEIEPFLALEEDEEDSICDNCDLLKTTKNGKAMVCATYKARNNYQLRCGGKESRHGFIAAILKPLQ